MEKKYIALFFFICFGIFCPGAGAARNEDTDSQYKNLVPYDGPQAQFADYYSRLGVYTSKKTKNIGIGAGTMVCQRNGKVFFDELCALSLVDEGGRTNFASRGDFDSKTVEFYPWCYASAVTNDRFRVTVEVVFHSIDLVVARFRVSNLGPENRKVTLLFSGRSIKDKEAKTVDFDRSAGTVRMSVHSKPPTPYPLVKEPDFTVYSRVRFCFPVSVDRTDAAATSAGFSTAVYEVSSGPLELKGNASWENCVTVTACQDYQELADRRSAVRIPAFDKIVSASREKWMKVFDALPVKVEPAYRKALYKAAIILTKNTIVAQKEQKFGSSFGPYRGTFPARFYYEALWVWDSAFQAMAFKEWDIGLAKDNIRVMFHNQDSNGSLKFLFPDSMCLQAQPPFFAWSAVQIYEMDNDKKFLEEMYPKFCGWMGWRMKNRDKNTNGLYEWGDRLESGWDTSPRWDKGGADKLEAVDINSFMVMDFKMLAKIAGILKKKDDQKKWSGMAEGLAARIVEKLYDPIDNLFYDYNYKTSNFVRILTPACFLPLWVGVPLEKNKKDGMIREHLLSTNFYGAVPFPVVGYNEPSYKSGDYWRGPMWLNTAYFMIDVLYKNGFESDAGEARKRVLDIVCKNEHIFEYYDSRTGAGAGAMDFSWSSAFVVEMVLDRFKLSGLE